MKRLFFCLTLLANAYVQAATPIDGWYSGLFAGYTYIPGNIDLTTYGLNLTHASYESGYDVGWNIGYKSTPMRYEGELTYLNANLNKFNVNGVPQFNATGYNHGFFGMANAYYDFSNVLNCLQPYLGLGIGYGWVDVNLNSSGSYGSLKYSGSNTVFGYQGTGGILYNFSENYALNLGYRYLATTHANQFGNLFQAQLASLGVVYRFNGNNYK